ncbi:MAG: hypothetical protein QM811_21805 [Pirellulales bacterium]
MRGALLGMLIVAAWSNAADPKSVAGNDPNTQRAIKRLRAELDAGEFGTATAAARAIPDSKKRDAALRTIALAQAARGSTDAATQTGDSLYDPTARATLARDLREPTRRNQAGGGAQADFDSLIELITTTTQPNTWKANGGTGDLFGFEGGVFCDPDGTLKRRTETDTTGALLRLRDDAKPAAGADSPRRSAAVRKISLARLEASVRKALEEGRPIPEEQRCLAGMQRIQYVFVYPAENGKPGDVVLAGPADDWRIDAEGRRIGVESGAGVAVGRFGRRVAAHGRSRWRDFRMLDYADERKLGENARISGDLDRQAVEARRTRRVVEDVARNVGRAKNRRLRIGPAKPRRAGVGRGRLSDEAGRHRTRAVGVERAELFGRDPSAGRSSSAAVGRVAMVVRHELRRGRRQPRARRVRPARTRRASAERE